MKLSQLHEHRGQKNNVDQNQNRDQNGSPLHLHNPSHSRCCPLRTNNAFVVSRRPVPIPAKFLIINKRADDESHTIDDSAKLEDQGRNGDAQERTPKSCPVVVWDQIAYTAEGILHTRHQENEDEEPSRPDKRDEKGGNFEFLARFDFPADMQMQRHRSEEACP